MKILITGNRGFIGSHLFNYFSKQHEIFGFDLLDSQDLRNYESCLDHTKVVDVVLHQAARNSVPFSIEFPGETFDNNITGFVNLIKASEVNKVRLFVYASSSAASCPMSPYGFSKRVNECTASLYNLTPIGLRYFNVYGPNQRDGNEPYAPVISKWLKEKEINIFGDGFQERSFTHVSDVVNANEIVLNGYMREDMKDKIQHKIFDVCGDSIKIIDLAEYMAKKLNKNIVFGPKRKGDIVTPLKEFGYLNTKLNFKPIYQGIDELIEGK